QLYSDFLRSIAWHSAGKLQITCRQVATRHCRTAAAAKRAGIFEPRIAGIGERNLSRLVGLCV
ncbi:hypothetical protein, partial [Paraburkholderia mimosarum]|uniref:hypothetical protein n=1 Tax=Paraburkholderia mimosarum TaxID=312026 RepID=UPI001AE0B411